MLAFSSIYLFLFKLSKNLKMKLQGSAVHCIWLLEKKYKGLFKNVWEYGFLFLNLLSESFILRYHYNSN